MRVVFYQLTLNRMIITSSLVTDINKTLYLKPTYSLLLAPDPPMTYSANTFEYLLILQ